jgi:hypothetical protein
LRGFDEFSPQNFDNQLYGLGIDKPLPDIFLEKTGKINPKAQQFLDNEKYALKKY